MLRAISRALTVLAAVATTGVGCADGVLQVALDHGLLTGGVGDATSGDSGPDSVLSQDIPVYDIPWPPAEAWDPYCLQPLFEGNGQTETSDPNCFVQDALFICSADAPAPSSPARIRRIDRDEMTRAGAVQLSTDLGKNPFEPSPHNPYSTYDADVSADALLLDLFLSLGELPGAGWTNMFEPRISYTYIYGGGDKPVPSCIFNEEVPEAACRANWVRHFLEGGLLFRPASDEELTYYGTLLDDALLDEVTTGVTREETLRFVTTAAWLSPEALFRQEFGQDAPDAEGRHRLTDGELGKQLAYMLGDRGPGAAASHTSTGGFYRGFSTECPRIEDATAEECAASPYLFAEGSRQPYLTDIRAAVADGTIQEPPVIEQLVRRYVGGIDPIRADLRVELSKEMIRRRGQWFLSAKLRDFFREWLGYMPALTAFKDTPIATSRFTRSDFPLDAYEYLVDPPQTETPTHSYNGNLENAGWDPEATVDEQLDDVIARIVMEDEDVFARLLTSRLYRVPSTRPGVPCVEDTECDKKCLDGRCYTSVWQGNRFIALVYDIADHVEETITGDPDTDPRWVEMPEGQRAGVLTHPAWLAAHGDAFEDGMSAILRGKWMRDKLFCPHVPPLSKVPPGAEIALPESHPDWSARRRIMHATGNSFCRTCHVRTTALGLAFEQYNHAGFLRGWDHHSDPAIAQGPVDASTTLEPATSPGAVPDPALQGRTFGSAVELVTAISESPAAKRCFIRQAFRYFAGRDETLADACTLAAMEQAYDRKGSFIDMLVVLATSDTMLFRHRPESPQTEVCR